MIPSNIMYEFTFDPAILLKILFKRSHTKVYKQSYPLQALFVIDKVWKELKYLS